MGKTTTKKADRVLLIYSRLVRGETLRKRELAQQFSASERTIQRDIETLRRFLTEEGVGQEIVCEQDDYYLREQTPYVLTNSEVLAVCKILLESRSMCQEEMFSILDKLIVRCIPRQNKKAVKDLIANEKYHYIEPHHGKSVLNGLWEIGQAIQNHQVMEIQYERLKEPNLVVRRVLPVGIMFSEYYFYLTAFLEDKTNFENPDDLYPTIYRIDRIRSFHVLNEHFHIPYQNRFEEGEFRKRVQFMFGGKLERITFRYTGPSLEAVLDRLPTAKVISQDDKGWIVRVEVYGKGIDMWLRSQGDYIELLNR